MSSSHESLSLQKQICACHITAVINKKYADMKYQVCLLCMIFSLPEMVPENTRITPQNAKTEVPRLPTNLVFLLCFLTPVIPVIGCMLTVCKMAECLALRYLESS